MKKLILFIFLIFSTNSYGSSIIEPLPLKRSNHKVYNFIITEYNLFKKNFSQEVIYFCEKQMVANAGEQQLIQDTKCQYNAAVDLANKHKFNYGKFSKSLYRWHQNLFPLAKNTVIAMINCYSQSCRNEALKNYVYKSIQLRERLFNDLDLNVKVIAEEAELEFINLLKKTKKNAGIK